VLVTQSGAKTFTVTNTNPYAATLGTVTLDGLSLAAPLSLSGLTTCATGAQLPPNGGACQIALSFAPTANGGLSQSLQLSFTVAGVGNTVQTQLTGAAIDCSLVSNGGVGACSALNPAYCAQPANLTLAACAPERVTYCAQVANGDDPACNNTQPAYCSDQSNWSLGACAGDLGNYCADVNNGNATICTGLQPGYCQDSTNWGLLGCQGCSANPTPQNCQAPPPPPCDESSCSATFTCADGSQAWCISYTTGCGSNGCTWQWWDNGDGSGGVNCTDGNGNSYPATCY
jgi:hypothetical protein